MPRKNQAMHKRILFEGKLGNIIMHGYGMFMKLLCVILR